MVMVMIKEAGRKDGYSWICVQHGIGGYALGALRRIMLPEQEEESLAPICTHKVSEAERPRCMKHEQFTLSTRLTSYCIIFWYH